MGGTAEVWERFHDNVYNFIRKRVRNEADTDDIVQDVFVKIHLNRDSLRDESKLQSWIYQISRNAIADYYRRESGNSDSDLPELEDMDVGFYGKQEMFCCLHPFIEELPEKYRSAVTLSDLNGKKQQEVAEILGISLSGAKSRVQRAREILKEKFVDCCNFTLDENGKIIGEQDCARCNH